MLALPTKQEKILDFIKRRIKETGKGPTNKEIARRLRVSSLGTIQEHLKKLEKKDYIKINKNLPRGIEIIESEPMIQIPLMGEIAAGQPIEAIENKETIAVPKNKLPRSGNVFALKVVGKSMIDENINDGDIVIIREQKTADNGQKVVALINNSEVTLKKIYRQKNRIRLQPANPELKSFYVHARNLMIQGIVIDVIKNIEVGVAKKTKILIPSIAERKDFIENNQIICGDAIKLLNQVKPDSIHLVLSDIPYGIALDEWDVLHANTNSALLGKSPAQEGKSAFKRRGKPINGWASADRNIPREYQDWCYSWAKKLYPLVKEGGSLFIFGARRTLHRALMAFEESGFLVRDVLAWEKPSAHHRAQAISGILKKRGLEKEAKEWEGWRLGNLAPKYEPIAWLFKPYRITITDNVLKNKVGAMNIDDCLIEGKSPTNILRFGFDTNEGGFHEAQKPVALLEYLIKLVTREGQTVLDPFLGSGSTVVAAKNQKRKYIGFEIAQNYCEIAKKRLLNRNHAIKKSDNRSASRTSLF